MEWVMGYLHAHKTLEEGAKLCGLEGVKKAQDMGCFQSYTVFTENELLAYQVR